MKGFPYVPWYHGDFLRSTVGWTLIEQAVYWKLLCAQCELGVLPIDPDRLAAIANTDPVTINAVWGIVGKKFVKTRGGLLNRRMDEHRKNYLDFRRRQSEGGKKGMANRYKTDANVVDFRGKDKPRG